MRFAFICRSGGVMEWRSDNFSLESWPFGPAKNYSPSLTLPTRIGSTSASLIDHISTTFLSDSYDPGILLTTISDHFPVFYIREADPSSRGLEDMLCRKINSSTISQFKGNLSSADWGDVLTERNPETAYANFFHKFEGLIEKSFPMIKKSKSCKNKLLPSNPWFTSGLLQ